MIPVVLVSLEVLDTGREMSYKHGLFSSPLLILNVMMFGSYVPYQDKLSIIDTRPTGYLLGASFS